jgi:hypothetical protein
MNASWPSPLDAGARAPDVEVVAAVVGSIVTIDSSSCASRVLHDREVIHLDGVPAPGLVLIRAPRAIAQPFEGSQPHVGVLHVGGRAVDPKLPLFELPPLVLRLALLSVYPIPMPLVQTGRVARAELLAVLGLGARAGRLRGVHRALRRVPFLLRACELRLGVLMLPAPEIEHRGGPEAK